MTDWSGSRANKVAPSFPVAVPQFGSQHRPAQRAPDDLAHDGVAGQVQPDDGVRPCPYEITDRGVVAVHHPAAGGGSGVDARPEVGGRQGLPSGLVVDRVEFDVRDAQLGGQRSGQGRLARTRVAHYRHPQHEDHGNRPDGEGLRNFWNGRRWRSPLTLTDTGRAVSRAGFSVSELRRANASGPALMENWQP